MRPYCSETDRQIVRDAVRRVGRGGGFIVETCKALEAAQIRWPHNFNGSKADDAMAIDRDMLAALDELRAEASHA